MSDTRLFDIFNCDGNDDIVLGIMYRFPKTFILIAELFKEGLFVSQTIQLPNNEGELKFLAEGSRIRIKSMINKKAFPFPSMVNKIIDETKMEMKRKKVR